MGSLRVRNWDPLAISDSNAETFPDREPVIARHRRHGTARHPGGRSEGIDEAGKRFTYRNPGIDRGIRFFQMQRMPEAPARDGHVRYRVRFTVVGIDLSALKDRVSQCASHWRSSSVTTTDSRACSSPVRDRCSAVAESV